MRQAHPSNERGIVILTTAERTQGINMQSKSTFRAVIMLAPLCFLVSCSDSDNVTLHKAGVYKGASDPLLEKLRNPEMSQKLTDRFYMVQSDR